MPRRYLPDRSSPRAAGWLWPGCRHAAACRAHPSRMPGQPPCVGQRVAQQELDLGVRAAQLVVDPSGQGRHERPDPAEFVGTGSYGRNVNRTDRLYALVEELRACAPRRRSARELALLYEVSARTIERDIGALQQAGVPIYADAGRSGGYTVDKSLTLPPLNFSPAEAVAVAVALAQVNVGPFEGAARSAVRKIVAAMPGPDVIAARDLAGRVRLLEPVMAPEPAPVPSVIEQAIVARRVLWICYLDRDGNLTERDVEPIVFMAGPSGWYLVGWCRVRGAARCFRVDRIQQAEVTGVTAPPRAFEEIAPCTPDLVARTPAL